MSNFEQTIAADFCWFGNHRGIALSGPNPTPPSIIGLGGVVLSRGDLIRQLFESEQNGTRRDSDDRMVPPSPSRHGSYQ
jgi:hypothetical protein